MLRPLLAATASSVSEQTFVLNILQSDAGIFGGDMQQEGLTAVRAFTIASFLYGNREKIHH